MGCFKPTRGHLSSTQNLFTFGSTRLILKGPEAITEAPTKKKNVLGAARLPQVARFSPGRSAHGEAGVAPGLVGEDPWHCSMETRVGVLGWAALFGG